MPIYFFYGKEEYIISGEINKLKNKLIDPAFMSVNFRIFYSPTMDNLIEICNTAPLMFGNIVSVVHCENYFFKLKNKKIDFSDDQIKSFDFALKNVSESNTIIFVCNIAREDNKKIDARTKFFKVITSHANVKEYNEFRDYSKEFNSFAISMLKEKNLKADIKTVNYLTQQLGVNLRLIDSELEKLKTAVYPEDKITIKDINEYCSLKENFFEFADLITGTDKNAILKYLDVILEKKHPLEVIALLQTNLHKLLYLKTYEKEKSAKRLAEELKMPEYPVKLMLEKIRNIELKELSNIKHNITQAEYNIKTGKVKNPEYYLETVLIGGFENV